MKQINVQEKSIASSDGIEIYFDHYQTGHSKVIVVAPGFYNSKKAILFRQMAEHLGDEYDVVVMDFRGHGDSGGLFYWTAKEHQDLEAVLEYAHKSYKKVGVIGFSLGAATGLVTASKSDLIDSLISVSAPSEFGKIDFHFWRLGVIENIIYNIFQEGRIGKGVKPGNLWLKKVKPIDIVQNIECPVLYIHGKKDWLIRPWHSRVLYKATHEPKKLTVVEDGAHAEFIYRKDKSKIAKMFKDWFSSNL